MRLREVARLLGAAVLAAILAASSFSLEARTPSRAAATAAGHAPLAAVARDRGFVRNVGQVGREDVLFHASFPGLDVGFTRGSVLYRLVSASATTDRPLADDEASIARPSTTSSLLVESRFVNARPVAPGGRGTLSHANTFIVGGKGARSHVDVPSYDELWFEGIWDGIDIRYRRTAAGLKYDYLVEAGASVEQIRIRAVGASSIRIAEDGGLVTSTLLGELHDAPPIAHTADGEPVACRFVVLGANEHGFAVDGWDGRQPLVIDPLIFSTYHGGSSIDAAFDVAVDASGATYVTGQTASTDFPTTPGLIFPDLDSGDVFVSKLNRSGTGLIYSTVVGGQFSDLGQAIAVGLDGSAYVTGLTFKDSFPTTAGSFQPDSADAGPLTTDAFVLRLGPDGDELVFASYLSGDGPDRGFGIAVDGFGNSYVVGGTSSSSGFPLTLGAWDTSLDGPSDAFLTKVFADGSDLFYSTLLGGNARETGQDVAVGNEHEPIVIGSTYSADFPTVPATPGAPALADVYVTEFSPTGASLRRSSFFGGGSFDFGFAIDLVNENPYIGGRTVSVDFPVTAGAADVTKGVGQDGFVARLDPVTHALTWATFVGGNGHDGVSDVAVHFTGKVTACGFTGSTAGMPITPDAIGSTYGGHVADGFLVQLSASGSSFHHGSYIGGCLIDTCEGVATLGDDVVSLTGVTYSTPDNCGFPITPLAHQTEHGGVYDGFVMRLFGLGTVVP